MVKYLIFILFICFTLAGCGLSHYAKIQGGYCKDCDLWHYEYYCPKCGEYYLESNKDVKKITLQYTDTWANFYPIHYTFERGKSTFEIKVYKKEKKIAEGYGNREDAKQIIDFLSDWLKNENTP